VIIQYIPTRCFFAASYQYHEQCRPYSTTWRLTESGSASMPWCDKTSLAWAHSTLHTVNHTSDDNAAQAVMT
jgi:hypothetical protein